MCFVPNYIKVYGKHEKLLAFYENLCAGQSSIQKKEVLENKWKSPLTNSILNS